jgi:hypothetical protein
LTDLFVHCADLLYKVDRFPMFLFDFFLCQFFITEPKDVFDDAWIVLQLVTKCNDLVWSKKSITLKRLGILIA